MKAIKVLGVLVPVLLAGTALAADGEPGRPYRLQLVPRGELELDPPTPPDVTAYGRAAVLALQPAPSAMEAIEVREASMFGAGELLAFAAGTYVEEFITRQQGHPRALYIDRGVATLSMVAQAAPDSLAATSAGTFIARRPIVIGNAATLLIRNETLRLSEERGGMLVNDGRLFAVDATIIGWRETTDSPASFVDQAQFRPFIVSWGGTATYLVDSYLAHLGYNMAKSYGLSISQYSTRAMPPVRRAPPTAHIIGTHIHDNYFGFYCYEAEDIVLLDNRFEGSVVYGIDPHDRSRGLIIAGNEISGSQKSHGIIFSRDVHDSWVFANHVHHNAGSGIVMDRNSGTNVILDNHVERNDGEGIAFYESPDNRMVRNRVIRNGRNGIYVRNSTNIRSEDDLVVGNAQYAINAFTRELDADGRDLLVDPYVQDVSIAVIGSRLLANGNGALRVVDASYIALAAIAQSDVVATSSGFSGVLAPYEPQILRALNQADRAVVLEPIAAAR